MDLARIVENEMAFEENLAGVWEDFVSPERRSSTLGPFLSAVLPKSQFLNVIDLAAGIGSDACLLAEKGYQVTANEISQPLARRMKRRCATDGVTISITDHEWGEIDQYFQAGAFDAALILGNSWSLLLDPVSRQHAARAISAIIRPGGQLVIDERNYPRILNQIRGGAFTRFRYAGRVIYCGRRVQGRPVSISKEGLKFEYYDAEGAVHGTLVMYPFCHGEIVDQFQQFGLQHRSTHLDLDLSRSIDEADFLTYVLDKPF